MEKKKILCLDLDGTIRRSKTGDFIKDVDDIEIIPGVVDAIKIYKELGYYIAIISNQGGIAHGFKTIDAFQEEWMATLKMLGPVIGPGRLIDVAFFCPYMADGNVEGYNYRSLTRKPAIGMLVLLESEMQMSFSYFPDWDNSLMVGDRQEDEQLAKNAEIPYMHINDFLNHKLS